MSNFNADNFLAQTVAGKMETNKVPVPEGSHEVQCVNVDIKSGTAKASGKTWVSLKLKFKLLDQNIADEMGMEEAFAYSDMFLDLDDDNTLALGTNKNVNLGKLREAMNLNSDEEFTLMDIKGGSCLAQFKHKFMEDGEPKAEIKSYASIDD